MSEESPQEMIPYVLATGTTPAAALETQAALHDVLGQCELRAVLEDKWHYSDPEWDFEFVELSRDDAIEGPIADALDAQKRWVRELNERSKGRVFHMIDPLSILIVGLSFAAIAVGTGAGQEAGKELYHGGKRRVTGPLRRLLRRKTRDNGAVGSASPSDSPLQRLFDSLGTLYTHDHFHGTPLFIRVLEPNVTFLCEPSLPSAAIQAAAVLVLKAVKGSTNSSKPGRPLRWNAAASAWEPLPSDWADRARLLALKHELEARATDPAS